MHESNRSSRKGQCMPALVGLPITLGNAVSSVGHRKAVNLPVAKSPITYYV